MQLKNIFPVIFGVGIFCISLIGRAQTTAIWVGPASGGEWNTAANWSTLLPPGNDVNQTTNALIGSGTNVNYNLPMMASSFGILTNNGELNVNTNGFNCSAITMLLPTVSKILLITNSGAAVNVSGNLTMGTNSSATLVAGASLTVGSLILAANESSSANNTTTFTNSGGTLNANSTTINNNSGTPTALLVISGGTNNLGNTGIGRYHGSSVSTPGTEGLAIYGGVVTMTNLNAGNGSAASFLTAYITGGIVTNFGSVFLNNATAGRYSRLLQTGGLFVVPDPGVVNPNSTVAGAVTEIYSVTGGTNIVGGFFFGNSNTLVAATTFFTNGGVIYVGSQGIATNGASINTISLNNGGLFGATTDWIGFAGMTLGAGTFTFQAADLTGTAHNITLSGVLSGTGALSKTGGGILTLLCPTNLFIGSTLINKGILSLGSTGAISNSTSIIVGSNGVFDVSAVSSGFVLNAGQTLSGLGVVTGAVTVASGGVINPGSNTLSGKLSFSNSVTETGGAVNHFDLAGAPNPNNDSIIIAGDFDVSNTNTVDISGASLQSGSVYILIKYGGNFNGGITNFLVTTAVGVLTNDPIAKTISFIPQATLRGATNIIWIGNPVNTNWDTEVSTNWLNAGALDFFVPGDNVQFTDAGAANLPVNLIGTVTPGSILFNSKSNYVIASTSSGLIGGTGSLTVTNSGTVTILTSNTYSGITTINSGVLAVAQLTNGLSASAIGAASSDAGNLVINNGTFAYFGPTISIDRGATLNSTNSTIDISSNGSLTLGGTLTGSGSLTLIDTGTLILSGANDYAGATTLSSGTLQVNGTTAIPAASTINFAGGTLSMASASSQQFYVNILNLVSPSTLIVNGANGNNIIGSSSGAGGFSGSSLLNLSIPTSGGICTINATFRTNFNGTIHVTDSTVGSLRFNSGGSSTGAQECTGSTNVTFDLGNGTVTLLNRNGGGNNFGNYFLGALSGGSTTFLRGSANASSSSIYEVGDKNLSTTYAGTIADGTGGSGATTAITKTGVGTFTLLGNNTYSGATTISNGILALAYNPTNSSDGSIGNSANINIVAGGVLDVSGRSDATLPLSSSQVISGNGTLRGILNTTGGGTVSPGGGINGALGILTVTNNINLGGIAWMKINRANTPNSDRLVSSTASIINYGGTLLVTNTGARLQVGDTFILFSASSLPGSFNLQLPTYYNWDTSQLSVNGSITVSAVYLPAISQLDFSDLANGNLYLYATNGQPAGGVDILTTTNLTLPISQWTTNISTGFDNNGQINHFLINVDPTLPQQFIILHGD